MITPVSAILNYHLFQVKFWLCNNKYTFSNKLMFIQVLDAFLSLKIKEVDFDRETKKESGKEKRERLKKMSRREKKVSCVLN